MLHSVLRPILNERDIRHEDQADVMEYLREGVGKGESEKAEVSGSQEELAESQEKVSERMGITHLVHAWHQQGHPVCFPFPI